MDDNYSTTRNRIHDKSHAYFVFTTDRWDKEKRNMFYGATDALLDASDAAASYGHSISANSGIRANLLTCYGFLQALYVQQDAVITLSRSFEIKWHPNDDARLKEIRDARNRLTGHPALAGEHEKPKRLSSAIIPYDEITQKGFRGHIYYERSFENIYIDAASFQNDNEERLALQMALVEKVMDEKEREFRNVQAVRPFSLCFGTGFDYLVQRLHCDLTNIDRVPQASAHAQMIRDKIKSLEKELTDRGFEPETKSLAIIFIGLELLENVISRGASSAAAQAEYDLIYDGLGKHIGSLKDNISAIDEKIRSPIP